MSVRKPLQTNLINPMISSNKHTSYDTTQTNVLLCIQFRSKNEETILPGALLELTHWLIQTFASVLDVQCSTDFVSPQHQQISNILKKLLEQILSNQFIMANIYLAKQEDTEFIKKLDDKMNGINNNVTNKKCVSLLNAKEIEILFKQLLSVNLDGKILDQNNGLLDEPAESLTYCLQPYIAVNVLLNPNCGSKSFASHLQMIQHLKNYQLSRVYCELIRASLICLYNVSSENDVSKESMWFAFTFIRVPHIIKHMNLKNGMYMWNSIRTNVKNLNTK